MTKKKQPKEFTSFLSDGGKKMAKVITLPVENADPALLPRYAGLLNMHWDVKEINRIIDERTKEDVDPFVRDNENGTVSTNQYRKELIVTQKLIASEMKALGLTQTDLEDISNSEPGKEDEIFKTNIR